MFHWYYLGVRNLDPGESAKNITSKEYLKIQGSEFRTLGFISPDIYWSEIRTITVKRIPALESLCQNFTFNSNSNHIQSKVKITAILLIYIFRIRFI